MQLQVLKTGDTFLMMKSPIDGQLKHIPTKITYSYGFDPESPEFCSGDEVWDEQDRANYANGVTVNIWLKVTASALGETGTDSLGGCLVFAQTMESDLVQLAIEHDMKNNACYQLREHIFTQWQVFIKAFTA